MLPDYDKVNFVNSVYAVYLLSTLSAWNAEIFTYPLDLIKTRLQIQGEQQLQKDSALTKQPYRGMIKTGLGIVNEEGLFKLWKGMHAVWLKHTFYSGIRVSIYSTLREKLFHAKPDENFALWKSAFCGSTGGFIAQFVSSPTELIKVQLMMEGKRQVMGLPPRVHGLVDAFQKALAEGGIRGLWRGCIPNSTRAALVALGDLSSYDLTKRYVLSHSKLEDGQLVRFISSIVAGLVGAILCTPVDVIKSRFMNQPVDKDGKKLLYQSSLECFSKSVRAEGFWALYKGFFPAWFRFGPWSLVFWITYEELLYLVGAKQF